ncbi:MAG: hypothetical protein QNJ45_03995 [Ardenticatenaceae bacterium]|nr:hypothetical protein [Ardenticatenaceae bacterium]
MFKRGSFLAGLALLISVFLLNQGSTVQSQALPSNFYLPIGAQNPANEGAIAYGVNFMNSVDHPADAQMFANGKLTGAVWNRWPLYWSRIETGNGVFDWSAHDPIVQADITNGFRTNAILLGTPSFYTTADVRPDELETLTLEPGDSISLNTVQRATPVGLYEPVFTDGNDAPGAGKTINPANRWARFVYQIVNRYKPGGTLARQNNWPGNAGITHWEMWNEPDFALFWDASQADYARLLKVGYLAAKHADSSAVVLFGGLANNGDLNFYENILTIFDRDPLGPTNSYFHDIYVTHSYSRASRSWLHVFRAERDLRDFNIQKPIWLNETGVPVWDDYPGPVWDAGSWLRGSAPEKADYVLQSAFYSIYAGADGYFYFQLYDGCGNQPAFTDFPPHNGELCDANGYLTNDPSKPCSGDAHGLFRNASDMICFSQHPNPESPRSGLAAFQILTGYAQSVQPLTRSRPNGTAEIIQLYQPTTNRRLVAAWALTNQPETVVIPAKSSSALLLWSDGTQQQVTPVNGEYVLSLPGATNTNGHNFYSPNAPFFDPSPFMIGGKTVVLIEDNG